MPDAFIFTPLGSLNSDSIQRVTFQNTFIQQDSATLLWDLSQE